MEDRLWDRLYPKGEYNMNRMYKVVWSQVRNNYVCVSEIAKNRTAGGRRTRKAGRVLALGIAAALLMGTVPAWADGSVLVTTRANGSSVTERINSGNILVVDNTTAKISNTDPSVSPDMIQFTKGEDDTWDAILSGGDEDGKGKESSNNTITITGTTVSDLIEGGRAKTVQNNQITLDNVTYDYVYGGSGENTASSNTITLRNGSTGYSLEGGQSTGGNADGNTVTVTDSTVYNMTMGGMVAGGNDMTGHANSSTVTLDNSSSNSVYGGFSLGTDASSNKVELKNGSSAGTVYGGKAANASTGSANGNTAILTDSVATFDVYGGFVQGTGTASENKVTIENSTVERANMVVAGFTNDAGGDIRDNTLILSGNTSINAEFTIAGYHYAGGSGNPNSYVVSGNKLIMNGESGDTLKLSALNAGGFALYGNAENNELTVSGGVSVQPLSDSGADEVKPQLYGGAAVDGDSTGNKVTISTTGEMKLASIMGGSTLAEDSDGTGLQVKDNSVTISSGDISITGITGGIGIRGGTGAGTVSDNTVTITGGTVNGYSSDIAGGQSESGVVTGNKVTLSGTASAEFVAFAGGISEKDGVVSDNTVDISTSGNVLAMSTIVGGYSATKDGTTSHSVTNNHVTISNGNVSTGLIAGGISAGTNEDKEVSGNTITLAGGTITPFSDELNIVAGLGRGGTVKDNVINLNGSLDLSNANLYGWSNDLKLMSSQLPTGITVTHSGNTLNVNAGDIRVGSLNNFDKIVYGTVPWKTDGSALTLAGDKDSDLSSTTVDTTHISFTNLSSIGRAGDYSMYLLNANGKETGLKADNLLTTDGTWDIGNALEGIGKASLDEKGNVVYKMNAKSTRSTEETHHAVIAREAELANLSAGRERMETVLGTLGGDEGVITFAGAGYGDDRYDTGSHVTSHNWNGIAGVGMEKKLSGGDLSYGAFYEYGKGNYDTSGSGFFGSGDTRYSGGGILARYENTGKTYVEGSLRFGRMKNNADDVLHGTNGNPYDYDTHASYWGGHIGVGHVFDLTHEIATTSRGGTARATRDLDLYGKYFHTHLGSGSFTAGGVNYNLDSVNSDILRIGARLNNRSGRHDFYLGLAWDYEFDGESRGTVSTAGLSAAIRKADMGGSSLMAEAGWKLESTSDNPWDIDIGVKAYVGQHRGFAGNVMVGYRF